jgi:hypothetical protein
VKADKSEGRKKKEKLKGFLSAPSASQGGKADKSRGRKKN